ncbi:glycosyltransferase family 4 protein [Priestia flexa]|uniref:glycosyltransferase family 4 protein n=1 Tax=Priestia flexa TaxID=86664 RepID=UPI0020406886|nr:glycosyltransferase family 4 protein [Priestia flexa]MCM3068380.1 glycosyltransferase family 4 protein [Priestia flexa]
MRILFISHYFPPETGAATKRIHGLAKHLVKFGHSVDVITGMPNYPNGEILKDYRKKFFYREQMSGINVYRYYVFVSKKKSTITRMLNYFSLVFSSLLSVFNRKQYDIIITSSPPLFLGISGVILSKFKKTPLIFDVRDIWPGVAAEIGEIETSSKAYKLMESLELFIYKNSRLITVVTKGKREKLIGRGLPEKKVKLISNGFDTEFLDYQIDTTVKDEYNTSNKFNILYAGIIGVAQGIDTIISVAEKLSDYKDIQFLLVGNGVEIEKLELLTKEKGLTNVTFTHGQPHERIRSFLEFSDIAVVPLKSAALSDSVPTKIYEALGAGVPVVLSASGESEVVINESGGGIVTRPGDIAALASAIMKFYSDKEFYKSCSENGQKHVLENYSRFSIAKKLEEELLTLIKNRSTGKVN